MIFPSICLDQVISIELWYIVFCFTALCIIIYILLEIYIQQTQIHHIADIIPSQLHDLHILLQEIINERETHENWYNSILEKINDLH